MAKKNLLSGKGKGIRGEKEKKKNGEKTEGEKRKKWKGKKRKERGRIEPPSRINLAQESNALPVTYCDSQASLWTVLDFYCDNDL